MKYKLLKIINHYGSEKQLIVWIEEMSELIKELCKTQRKNQFTKDIKLEVTDVQICLDQIKMCLGYTEEEQEKDYAFKVDRQLKRMESEKND